MKIILTPQHKQQFDEMHEALLRNSLEINQKVTI